MSAHTDTNQNFDQAELEQLVSIVLENMRTKNDRFFPHRFQLFKSLGLKRLLELFKTNDLPSWVVDACVSDRDEANHWSWYDLCDIPDELLLNYIDTFGKDSPNKYLAGIQRQRTLLAYSLIVLLANKRISHESFDLWMPDRKELDDGWDGKELAEFYNKRIQQG